ncbi:SAM-dependent methyltransferase [Streptomyces sp. XD-27]|nr:SAM-dependent methyltransferase [Streptomyces sp. XD-27]WKX74357.1 SAM-dependent methyltransferase [Streptomyces sp. XD-27]
MNASSGPEWLRWRTAAERALYGPEGFFRRPEGPAGHFRTSVHASPRYAEAVAELLRRVDTALGRPAELALVDMGAGRGELLTGVLAALDGEAAQDAARGAVPDATASGPDEATAAVPGTAPYAASDAAAAVGSATGLVARLRLCAVERAARPDGLDPRVEWLAAPPEGVQGLLFANEWLDNVPVDIAETGPDGVPRYVLVAPDGTERPGPPVDGADADWLARWWPLDEAAGPGARAEIGRPRDEAWAAAVRCLRAGLAVAVDYAHTRATRPPFGTLTGFREGREVRPVPDGSCDLTAHVALDACATAGHEAVEEGGGPSGGPPHRLTQRDALRALGVTGRRPPLALASRDPVGYVRALAAAGAAAELTDPAGLGAFGWLLQPVGTGCRDLGRNLCQGLHQDSGQGLHQDPDEGLRQAPATTPAKTQAETPPRRPPETLVP